MVAAFLAQILYGPAGPQGATPMASVMMVGAAIGYLGAGVLLQHGRRVINALLGLLFVLLFLAYAAAADYTTFGVLAAMVFGAVGGAGLLSYAIMLRIEAASTKE